MQRESSLRIIFPSCHFVGGNYWVLKTTHQNRGIGIYVFKTILQLRNIMDNYVCCTTKDHNDQQVISVAKPLTFIIQKYIEKPYLIDRRKFDIRVWVLVNQDFEVFFYKEGYLRTSCTEYRLDNCED